MALVEHKKAENGKYELIAKIEAADFLAAVEKVYRRENKKISIPGFRKGKAPRAVIERMYGEGFFYEDALNELLPDVFENALNEADIDMIGRPEVDVTEMSRETGATVKFTVELRPELNVKAYKGISVTKKVHTVEDEDVDAELRALQEKGSRIITVEDRAAEEGDIAVIDFEGFKDGVAFAGGKGENYDLHLGSGQFVPGFEEQIVGHSKGDAFDIDVTFPEAYGAKDLAGKAVVFKIKLHELRRKELPALDDELAKDVSEFDTLDELKNSIRERLEKEADDHATAEAENELVDAVAETLEGDIPEAMIEDRMSEMARDFEMRLRMQGLDLGTYLKYTGGNKDTFAEQFREGAAKFVKNRLALEAVVRAENITVSDEDVEKEYARIAEENKTELDRVKELVPEKELKKDLCVNKAIDAVRENAKIETVKLTKEDLKKEAEKRAAERAKKAEEENK